MAESEIMELSRAGAGSAGVGRERVESRARTWVERIGPHALIDSAAGPAHWVNALHPGATQLAGGPQPGGN
jgi:hypothetical protein